jgi:hypothetical protein
MRERRLEEYSARTTRARPSRQLVWPDKPLKRWRSVRRNRECSTPERNPRTSSCHTMAAQSTGLGESDVRLPMRWLEVSIMASRAARTGDAAPRARRDPHRCCQLPVAKEQAQRGPFALHESITQFQSVTVAMPPFPVLCLGITRWCTAFLCYACWVSRRPVAHSWAFCVLPCTVSPGAGMVQAIVEV